MSLIPVNTSTTYGSTTQFNEKGSDTVKTFTFQRKKYFDLTITFTDNQTQLDKYELRNDKWFSFGKTMLSIDQVPLMGVENTSLFTRELAFRVYKGLHEMKGSLKKLTFWGFLFESQLEDFTLNWFSRYTLNGRSVQASMGENGVPVVRVERTNWFWPTVGKVTIDMDVILDKYPQWRDKRETLEYFLLTVAAILFNRLFEDDSNDHHHHHGSF